MYLEDRQCANESSQFWTDPCLMQFLTDLAVPISAHFISLSFGVFTAEIINYLYLEEIGFSAVKGNRVLRLGKVR